jgi:hypothetical protein
MPDTHGPTAMSPAAPPSMLLPPSSTAAGPATAAALGPPAGPAADDSSSLLALLASTYQLSFTPLLQDLGLLLELQHAQGLTAVQPQPGAATASPSSLLPPVLPCCWRRWALRCCST